VKCADDIVVLAKEVMVLQCVTDLPTEIEIPYGMEKNVENLKATILNTAHERSKTTGKCRILKLFE
jgi:hypothetical protein